MYIGSAGEQYRVAVKRDTKRYLTCREWYFDRSKHFDNEDSDADTYSQRMCEQAWSWWNYEVLSQKFLRGGRT